LGSLSGIFHQPAWVSRTKEPAAFWISIGVFSTVSVVLAVVVTLVTLARRMEMRSFRKWTSRPAFDESIHRAELREPFSAEPQSRRTEHG